jgi:hypothetical protein
MYNILLGFGVHIELTTLVKMCLNETYTVVKSVQVNIRLIVFLSKII